MSFLAGTLSALIEHILLSSFWEGSWCPGEDGGYANVDSCTRPVLLLLSRTPWLDVNSVSTVVSLLLQVWLTPTPLCVTTRGATWRSMSTHCTCTRQRRRCCRAAMTTDYSFVGKSPRCRHIDCVVVCSQRSLTLAPFLLGHVCCCVCLLMHIFVAMSAAAAPGQAVVALRLIMTTALVPPGLLSLAQPDDPVAPLAIPQRSQPFVGGSLASILLAC